MAQSLLSGDENGHIKIIYYSGEKSELNTLHSSASAVRCISVDRADSSVQVAAAYADGSISAYTLENGKLKPCFSWKESRLKPIQRFISLTATESVVYSCTSGGALRRNACSEESEASVANIPTRLSSWRLASGGDTFSYCGDEVELSIWNVEKAFGQSSSGSSESNPENSKKRKRKDTLFPAEVWRAKNVENDHLSLRQPVRNTCMTYLSSPHHLAVGTEFGDIRTYDTRAARKPVANWKKIGKVGGVKVVEKGFNANEIFVGDGGASLFSIDSRNGSITYGYKGLCGAITSISHSPTVLASTSADRYLRIHSTFPPLEESGNRDYGKGEVLEKIYTTSIPTVVVWVPEDASAIRSETDADEDDVWDGMDTVIDDDSGRIHKKPLFKPTKV